MNILVFGAGAVGSLLGGLVARMGHNVSLVGRAAHLDIVERQGLHITGLWGEYRIRTFDVYRAVSEIPETKRDFDLILCTVKAFDTEAAVEAFAPLVGPRTAVLSFQNGLGNVEAITRRIHPDRFLAGRIITGVELEPGTVRVTVSADDLVVGALEGAKPVLRPEDAVRLLKLARIPARAVPDILTHIWSKAIYNCALNGLCSARQIPYGRILETEEGRKALEAVVNECYAVASKKGIALNPPDAAGYYRLLVDKLIPVTATHYPSMLRDLQRSKPTEIDALNGAIARMGKEFGVSTPQNEEIIRLVTAKTAHKS